VPEPSAFEVEIAIGKLKEHKQLGIDQIPAELIKAGVRTIRYGIHKLINSICNRIQIIVIIQAYHFCQACTNFNQHAAVKANSICRGNYWG
jgi:hypothetical protein